MKKKAVNSARTPIYRDAGFELFDAVMTESAFRNETEHERDPDYFIYSRYRNPTVVAAEEEIMKLEGCSWALLAQTGMSAIDIATSVFQKGGKTAPWVFFSEIYGGTISYVESVLKARRGIDARYFNAVDGRYNKDDFRKMMEEVKPELVYIETVSNPMLIVADVPEIIQIASGHGAKVVVDNTFATPLLFRPLDAGAHIVIHSATKYFSGHGNLTAGVLCGNDRETMQAAIEYRKFVGHMLSPDDAYRLQTQIKTFKLRFGRQCSNASRLADHLAGNPLISRVWYPGLKNHGTHDIAGRLFEGRGFGGMITFDFAGKDQSEKRRRRDMFISLVTDSIRLIPTLGDPHTILMPVEAVWGAKYPEPGMIRLSVGFEEYDGLEATVSGALDGLI